MIVIVQKINANFEKKNIFITNRNNRLPLQAIWDRVKANKNKFRLIFRTGCIFRVEILKKLWRKLFAFVFIFMFLRLFEETNCLSSFLGQAKNTRRVMDLATLHRQIFCHINFCYIFISIELLFLVLGQANYEKQI